MDGICIDESTSDSISVSPATVSPLRGKKSPERLSRLGSVASVVLDSESSVEAESRKLPSSQYKGVVPQPNGRWGAQIYEKHQRVWLGTFNEEEEAAKAYDIAAQRFRGRDAVTNFKPLSEADEDDIEAIFLNSHSKAEIVDMLRKHTYSDELGQSKRKYGYNGDGSKKNRGEGFMASSLMDRIVKAREQLFDKAVTPSDVGKLNRLVIPKQHAEKHFPLQNGSTSKGVLLNFEDNGGKVWRFRYSYWNSSQSYVMTKGWSRFVKEKKLDAGDIVSFERGVGELGKDRLYIDWRRRPDAPDPASFPLLPLRHPLSLPRSVPWSRVYLPTPTVSMPSPDLVHFQQLNYAHRHRHQTSYSGSTYGYHAVNPGSGSVFYLRSSAAQHAGVVQQGGGVPMVIDSVPVVHGKAATKRVRLFGVNLDCPISEEPECDILSSTIVPHTPMVSISSHSQLPPSLPSSQLRLYSSAPLPTAPDESPRRGNQSFFFNLDN